MSTIEVTLLMIVTAWSLLFVSAWFSECYVTPWLAQLIEENQRQGGSK